MVYTALLYCSMKVQFINIKIRYLNKRLHLLQNVGSQLCFVLVALLLILLSVAQDVCPEVLP